MREIDNNRISLINIKEIQKPSFNKNIEEYDKFYYETVINLKNNIYTSYDSYVNQKYKIDINYQTVERLKNYFR